MSMTCNLRLTPFESANDKMIKKAAAKALGIEESSISAVQINRKSIDTRRREPIIDMSLTIYQGSEEPEIFKKTVYNNVEQAQSVLVVGSGPAGLFAALRLIEKGMRPIIFERGEDVHKRKVSMASITTNRVINPDSNYSFGEGGAGAFSDGKLYTRSQKRGDVSKVLSQFCQHGASLDILSEAHPHIGTDKLPQVIENMRNTILNNGGVVMFETKVTQLLYKGNQVIGLVTQKGEEFHGPVILAIGHSSRDFYQYLSTTNTKLEAKGIACGVRLEHPQALIDQIQYKNPQGRGEYLPAASYSFVTQAHNRGVYSFCMCPGGFVIPAMTDNEQVVVNGMSPSLRNGKFANSAMVVEIRSEDLDGDDTNPLKMMAFQSKIERVCYTKGGSNLSAPAQRMADFVNGKVSADLPESSYILGLKSADLATLFPQFISARLKEAFATFGRQAHGFLTNEAVMIATESRTSSPVRIVRDPQTFQAVNNDGLYPCGEGAGYAGGIVSSALDGINVADAVIARYR